MEDFTIYVNDFINYCFSGPEWYKRPKNILIIFCKDDIEWPANGRNI
jgi:hypothetical protein